MLRNYQKTLRNDIYEAWGAGDTNVLAVAPTGSGKTVLFADIVHSYTGASCAVAHRQELVTQMSLAVAREGVLHNVIGPPALCRLCGLLHSEQLDRAYYTPNARTAVAGVDTLQRRVDSLQSWGESISLWVMDEAHHVLRKNKWGKALALFPNARGLGVTATPLRTDGMGLGRNTDGVFDIMVAGPTQRWLMGEGYLTDYKIYAPPSNIDTSRVEISKATGDFVKPQISRAVRESTILGDIVGHYKRLADGQLGVTFVTDVETAGVIAQRYNEAGVPAEVVTAKTPARTRFELLRRFANRDLLQLVNVDIFGEGFDLPAISVVSMARPTQSYGLYVQQFGRGLRPLSGKSHAVIIDHVGNVLRHGLPDAPRQWTLDRREKRATTKNAIFIRVCPECTAVYDRTELCCPYCGFEPIPLSRSKPEHVDGDLYELDAETLARMRGEVARVDMSDADYEAELLRKRCPEIGIRANVKRHGRQQTAQGVLRDTIAWWAGLCGKVGQDRRVLHKLFYLTFGVDVLSAQALGENDAIKLTDRINFDMGVR